MTKRMHEELAVRRTLDAWRLEQLLDRTPFGIGGHENDEHIHIAALAHATCRWRDRAGAAGARFDESQPHMGACLRRAFTAPC